MVLTTRGLLLMTADWITAHPERYEYTRPVIPARETEQACLLAWMAHFAGRKSGLLNDKDVRAVVGQHETDFFNRLDQLTRGVWYRDAREAARALYLYAERYHPLPPEERFDATTSLPGWRAMLEREHLRRLQDADREHEEFRRFRAALDLVPSAKESGNAGLHR